MTQRNQNVTETQKNTSQQNPVGQTKSVDNFSTLVSSFFEITISSEKLNSIFEKINDKFRQQNQRIEILEKDLSSLSAQLTQKIDSESRRSGLLFTKLDLRINQSANAQHCSMLEVHKKAEARDHELDRRIESVNSRVGRVQDTAKQEIKMETLKLKKQIIGQVHIEKQQALTETKQEHKQLNVDKKQNKANQIKLFDFNSLKKHFENEISKLRSSVEPTFLSLYQKKQNEKKDIHAQEMLDLTYKKQLFDPMSTKQNIKVQNEGKSRVVYPSFKRGTVFNCGGEDQKQENQKPSFKQSTRHLSLTRNSTIQSDILRSCYAELVFKVEKFEKSMLEQTQRYLDLKNKQIVLDQKINILQRKIQKNCLQVAETKSTFRRLESQKQDQKALQQLKHYTKWAIRDLEDKMTQKCSEEDLIRQKTKLVQKLSILHENLIEKADKSQIQKALIFLQGKIKQIIFLIAADHSQQKEGAITKIAAKCLSCDKQIQRQVQSQLKCRRQINLNQSKQSQGQYIKSMTHRVRQRYKKQAAKTAGNEGQGFDD